MKIIKATNYQVEIGSLLESSFSNVLSSFSGHKIIIIVDENTHDNCLDYLITSFNELERAEIVLLPTGETNKVMEVCFQVWQALTEYNVSRKDLIINLGGGMVSDMGGFIASIYKRGLKFINVPTSLLGMVDAAIGGKNGIDLEGYKNQLGTFSHPSHIFIDPVFLATLPGEEIFNGYAEMLKHALIQDKNLWLKIQKIHSENDLIQEDVIHTSILIKTKIIDKDPLEGGLRKILNFGHTLGHAIESFYLESDTKETLTHGEAIAIGMICESYMSSKTLNFSEKKVAEIKETILSIYPKIQLLSEDFPAILDYLKHDKKNVNGHVNFVLLFDFEDYKIDCKVSDELIMESMEYYNM